MLRVVRLPDAAAEPAPVSLDTGHALDDCIRREGWLVFMPNVDVWGMPLPLGERPFKIAAQTHVVAIGADPRTVWLHGHNSPTIFEYDGVAREVRQEIELPGPQFSVTALTASGFLLHNDHTALYEWEPPQEPRLLLDDIGPSTADGANRRLACLRYATDELVVLDLGDRSHLTVPQPEEARWALRPGVFSPDGKWLAADLDYSPERTEEEALATLTQIALGDAPPYEPEPHQLGIIRCSDGTMTIADGVYDNFAKIAWSLDSEWIVFSTPFAPRGLWLTRPDAPKLEWISFGRRHAPSLLCDASDLLS